MKRIITTIALPLMMLSHSMAGTATTGAKATAVLNNVCYLSTTDINFGVLDLTVGSYDANGSINVLCTRGTTYGITMTFGHVEAQQAQAGNMIGQQHGDIITYGINSSYHSGFMWGKDYPVNGTGTGVLQVYTMYGRAYTGLYGHTKYPIPDSYKDTVTTKVTF
ncbi:spore coat protein U domain-containing protein [Ralstonia pseudosolanacearum]